MSFLPGSWRAWVNRSAAGPFLNADSLNDWEMKFRALDCLGAVRALGLVDTLPGSPADGDAYLTSATATPANKLVRRFGGTWETFTPPNGMVAWLPDGSAKQFLSGAWGDADFSGGGAVASVFGRMGAVVAQSGDYTAAQVGALPTASPTYTGRLTGPTQYLEADEQIHLAIRRPGGNSGRIHGIAFQAQNDASAWVEFGRLMTYISSVVAGVHAGGMRLMAYKDGAILQALEAGPDGVRVGAGLPLQMGTTTVVDSSRNGSFAGLTATGNPEFGSASAGSSLGLNSQAGTVAGINLKDNGVIRATLQLYTGNVFRIIARDASGVEIDNPVYIPVEAGGEILLGGSSNRPLRHTGTFRLSALTAATVRPATIGTDGTVGAQDPATFRTTIGAAATSHNHDASQITSGTLDVARIPVLPSQIQIASSGDIADLTTEQQGQIGQGTVVTTVDGRRWVYKGTGTKTLETSFIELADITPEWTAIANKPSLLPASNPVFTGTLKQGGSTLINAVGGAQFSSVAVTGNVEAFVLSAVNGAVFGILANSGDVFVAATDDGVIYSRTPSQARTLMGAAKAPSKQDVSASATIGSIDDTSIKVVATDVVLTLSGGVDGQGWDIINPTTSTGIAIPTGATLWKSIGYDIGPATISLGGGKPIRITRIDANTWTMLGSQ